MMTCYPSSYFLSFDAINLLLEDDGDCIFYSSDSDMDWGCDDRQLNRLQENLVSSPYDATLKIPNTKIINLLLLCDKKLSSKKK